MLSSIRTVVRAKHVAVLCACFVACAALWTLLRHPGSPPREHLTFQAPNGDTLNWKPLMDEKGTVLPNSIAGEVKHLYWFFRNGFVDHMKRNKAKFLSECAATPNDTLMLNPLIIPISAFTAYNASRKFRQWVVRGDFTYPCFGDKIMKDGKMVGYTHYMRTKKVALQIWIRNHPGKANRYSIRSFVVTDEKNTTTAPPHAGPYTGDLVTALPAADLFEAPGGGAWKITGVDKAAATLVKEGQDHVVRVRYPKDSGSGSTPMGSRISGGMRNGDAFPLGLPASAIVLAFDVCFGTGFNFADGGKLLGLGVGVGPASGKDHSPTAASHRINFQKDGSAVSYIYIPQGLKQSNTKLTDDGGGNKFFADIFPAGTLKVGDGQYNHIELGIKINSFDATKSPEANGIAVLTINGVSGEVKDVRWSARPDLLINYVTFNTFFGGKTPSQIDSVAYFKNFALHAWKG